MTETVLQQLRCFYEIASIASITADGALAQVKNGDSLLFVDTRDTLELSAASWALHGGASKRRIR